MTESTTDARGLAADEVAERIAAGQVNEVEDRTSRSVASILQANIFTRFNAILGTMLVIILVFGHLPDALFGLVMIINSVIGVVQELRAKQTLDRLTLMAVPRTSVVRDGRVRELTDDQIVLDDVIRLGPGDQLGVDCTVLHADGLQLDESLLTGEAEPVAKSPGDEVLSGSFVVAGSGVGRACRVGSEAYARRIVAQAREFTLAKSELRVGINRILQVITWVLVPTAVLLFVSQLGDFASISAGITGAVAGVVAMVPEGLVLLTSLAMAVAVIRLGRRHVVVQELPAVETLARVDVVCLDKTGTLTEGRITFESADCVPDSDDPARAAEVSDALAALAAADANPNPSLRAIANAFPDVPDWGVAELIPFSSARKFSAVTFEDRGTWILGAPEIVSTPQDPPAARERAAELAATGKRVLLLSHSPSRPARNKLPSSRRVVATVTLSERVRPDAGDTIRYFTSQDVTPKVISGDNPVTVSAIAREAQVPDAGASVDARTLPDDPDALAEALDTHAVFGRVSPHQKQAMVGALQRRGHTVAMTGDGVNDVLALKDADIGIAMGAGSDATKAVSQLVLLENDFAVLPGVVAEGRRIIANIERVASLFLTKTVYATLLALTVGVLDVPFPFLPRHLSLVGSLTIGIPAFFLSFAPSQQRARPGFIPRVMRFAVPAGIVAGAATFTAYAFSGLFFEAPLEQARTAATITLLNVGLWVLVMLARPLTPWRLALIVAMYAAFLFAMFVPFASEFFALHLPPLREDVLIAGIVLASIAALEGLRLVMGRWRFLTPA